MLLLPESFSSLSAGTTAALVWVGPELTGAPGALPPAAVDVTLLSVVVGTVVGVVLTVVICPSPLADGTVRGWLAFAGFMVSSAGTTLGWTSVYKDNTEAS